MDSKTLPVITTPRVVLRWLSEDDIDSLYEIFSSPQVMRYWSSVPLPERAAAADLQREIANDNESETMFKWGLALRDSNTGGSRLDRVITGNLTQRRKDAKVFCSLASLRLCAFA